IESGDVHVVVMGEQLEDAFGGEDAQIDKKIYKTVLATILNSKLIHTARPGEGTYQGLSLDALRALSDGIDDPDSEIAKAAADIMNNNHRWLEEVVADPAYQAQIDYLNDLLAKVVA